MQIHSDPRNTSSFKKGLWLRIIVSIIIISTLGSLSGILTGNTVGTWYGEINKPFFTPPNWVFGPAWLLLYTLMGISVGRIWQLAAKNRYPIIRNYTKKGILLFVIHFIFNLAWTPIFFGLQMPGLALIVILTMLGIIIFMTKQYYRVDRIASFLLVPYIVWVSFATLLNASIWWMN